ncbi:MAG: CHC2 zinc finger domain-containing protein [Thermodesulfobacteriota bacterium]
MMITKEEIEAVKRSKDLVSVIQSRGIELKKKGKNYVALCPFHTEKTPSFTVNPRTNLWHCFGCNAGGDVIGFLCKTEDIGFREAMEKLSRQYAVGSKQKKEKKAGNSASTVSSSEKTTINHTHLLNRVVSFYHQSFLEDRRALEYLKGRGITDEDILLDFKVGFSNGTLLNTIPDEGEVIDGLKDIGILNERGHEMFYNCVVFPIFNENRDCVGMYGRKLDGSQNSQPATRNSQPVTHLYLPGPRKGVFNYQAIKRSETIILTESIIDCLTLHNAGFKDVIPCYGVNGLTDDHLSLFNRHKTKEVYICFDGDDAGREGAIRISHDLKERGIGVYTVDIPQGEDINSYLHGRDPKEFDALLKKANPGTSIRSDKAVKQEQRHYERTGAGFIIQYGERTYEVKGINREGVKLKTTIKAIKQRSAISGQQSGETRNSQLATRNPFSSRYRRPLLHEIKEFLCQGLLSAF